MFIDVNPEWSMLGWTFISCVTLALCCGFIKELISDVCDLFKEETKD